VVDHGPAVQRGGGERDVQRGEQVAAEHVAGHVPGEDQQRDADGRDEQSAERGDGGAQCAGGGE